MTIAYRIMKPEDIVAGLSLCRSARWNQLQRDWEIFLSLGPRDCRVALAEEKIVGTVTTISYDRAFSWIGMVLVDPDYRRMGIGKGLLEEALHILASEETVKLDATPDGRQVYLKLGFKDEYPLSRMSAIIDQEKLTASTARPMQDKDLETIAQFDREFFGANRKPLLKWLFEGAPQYAFVMEGLGGIQGYCLGRKGFNFMQIGPIVAENTKIAQELASAALSNCIGQPVILDVLHHHSEWLSWVTETGFVEQRPFIRMFHGLNRFPGIPEKQFAIAGPEFG
ncbi:MAG: GNAT family N-acetyltransferase [Chitinophagaceae bacterium]|nr:GNAT family N-acetyltransferase [Chitinophagaceae bacterium]